MKNPRPYGGVSAAIRELLAQHECLPLREIAEELNISYDTASPVLQRMLKSKNKKVYIHSWQHTLDSSSRYYPRAMYALGNKKNAKKPKPLNQAQRQSRYRARNRMQVSSVFDLGISMKAREARQKQIRAEHAQMKRAEAALEAMARDAQELGLGYEEDVRQVP